MFPYPRGSLQSAEAWYASKDHCLVSTPIEQDEDLRGRLRNIEKLQEEGNFSAVQLYAISQPKKVFEMSTVEEGKLLVCLIIMHCHKANYHLCLLRQA